MSATTGIPHKPSSNRFPDSFSLEPQDCSTDQRGQRAHRLSIEHSKRFERKLWAVKPGVWSMVGNGLSNQSFVDGPEGIIVIDTGECNEEMASALAELRKVSNRPIAAVIYTHFHYVGGTAALLTEQTAKPLPIWGHERIVSNRLRVSGEVSAAYSRGMVHQFGMFLPEDGADGLVNVGLGMSFRNPAHAPYTEGFIAPNNTVGDSPSKARIAGLEVEFTWAQSDCDDSLTIWFPELKLAVNNLLWPALFNIFPIRGEEYRDPRILLEGLDHLHGLQPEFLLGAHGPPLAGKERLSQDLLEYRDSIQFIWDQSVRGINLGLNLSQLTEFVQLPPLYSRSYLTTQLYGLVEHHVRQVHSGVRGWFDGDEANLFPLPTAERARRLVQGFGGADQVRTQAQAALQSQDFRWALELSSWLIRLDTEVQQADRDLLASVLRQIAQRTTSANVRNWLITRARELDGQLDLSRFRRHRFDRANVLSSPPEAFVKVLRVLLVPERAAGIDQQLAWHFDKGTTVGLHIRNGVAVPRSGKDAQVSLRLSLTTWANLLANKLKLSDALADGSILTDDPETVRRLLGCFDHPALV